MKITAYRQEDTPGFSKYTEGKDLSWKMVVAGYWAESPYHSGYVEYLPAAVDDTTWILRSVERDADLDDITEDDVEQGRLNDDQLQALWGQSLEEAQAARYERDVALCIDAPKTADAAEMANVLYFAAIVAGATPATEVEIDGLLDER